jgi:hypothetical protein
MDERDERKRSSVEASKGVNDIKTGVFIVLREKHGGYPTYWPCGVRCIGDAMRRTKDRRSLTSLSFVLSEWLKEFRKCKEQPTPRRFPPILSIALWN